MASRFLWAVGYYANEDYFVPSIQVDKLPVHLHRGKKYVADDGAVQDVRMKRYLKGEKKLGDWDWEKGPFAGTRELNGLRTLMAVMNNWDLKDVNNAIYQEKDGSGNTVQVYTISDLGASFGTPGISRTHEISKGNLKSYSRSKFIRRVDGETVDFESPGRRNAIGNGRSEGFCTQGKDGVDRPQHPPRRCEMDGPASGEAFSRSRSGTRSGPQLILRKR